MSNKLNKNTINSMVSTLFPRTKNINEVVDIIYTYGSKFGVNTNLRLAHYLAQVREEIGDNFEPKVENLNYSEDALIKTFKVFKDKPELADMYGRDEDTPKANQEAIANLAYANRMGNGNADSDGDGDMDKDDDGFKYRGRGTLQITGKYNYQEVQKRIDKYSPNSGVNIITGSNVDTLTGSILIGMGFWIWKDLYRLADKGSTKQVVDSITQVINKYTSSYDKRYGHFTSISKLI